MLGIFRGDYVWIKGKFGTTYLCMAMIDNSINDF